MENTPEVDSEEASQWKTVYLPPGYMFDPYDIEIFKSYLLPMVKGEHFRSEIIPEADIYQCQPSQLADLDPKQACSYFFTKTDKRYKNGTRRNRCTKDGKGFWRMTSKINEIKDDDGNTIGRKNVLVYVSQNKVKTNWIMYEYILDCNYVNKDEGDRYDTTSVALCKIYERKAENNWEDGDGCWVRGDIQQNHKRESPSQSDDHDEETSDYPAKRSKPAPMNQTLDVQPISQQPEAMMMQTYWEDDQPQLYYHPLHNVQPISQQQPAAMMQTWYGEAEGLQPLDQVGFHHINGCNLMDQTQLPHVGQPISQQPAEMMQTWYGEAEVFQPLDLVGFDHYLMDQTQLPHLFDAGQPIISQQPAATTMQTFGEEALPPFPSLDQMASYNFEPIYASQFELENR